MTSCCRCGTMLAASLVIIFLSQTPIDASRERPYCQDHTANQCCEAQNEKFDVQNKKLEAQNEKLEALNEKLEAQNEKLEALNEKLEAPIKPEHNCKLVLDGEVKHEFILTNNMTTSMPNHTKNVNISVWGSPSCTLRILAVGGGGGEYKLINQITRNLLGILGIISKLSSTWPLAA